MSDSDLNRINQTEQTELSEANQAETFKNSSTAKNKDNSTGNDVIFAQGNLAANFFYVEKEN